MSRVIYKKNPLVEVIIQYRFPKILSLNNNDPVDFQEKIRKEYPIYQLTLENQQEISFSVEENNSSVINPSVINKQATKNHNFISADGAYKINLTSSFISISTLSYSRWEELSERFMKVLKVFEEIYLPPFYDRIGLRYIDAFSRNNLNLGTTPWKELIKPHLLGAYSFVEEDKVINSHSNFEYLLDDGFSRAKINSGIGAVNDSTELMFILDQDFICINNIALNCASTKLNYLHDQAKTFISTAICDTLHTAMEPEVVE